MLREFMDEHTIHALIYNNEQFPSDYFFNSTFERCNYKTFIDCTFNNCKFVNTNFAGARLYMCRFNNCTFEHCNFYEARLRQSDFTTSIFKDCTKGWHSAHLEFAQFNEEFKQELVNLVFQKVIFKRQ